MDWHQFLQEERKRKLTTMGLLGMRRITMFRNGDDVSPQHVAELSENVAEIEAILMAAGVGFDA